MLALENFSLMQQNVSSMSDRDGIFILDKDGTILFANDKARCVYAMQNELNRVIAGDAVDLEHNGREIALYPIFEDAELKLFFGVVRDMSDMLEIKEFLDVTYEKVKNFREDVAHYFFNPLVIAKGYLDLVQDTNLSEEDREKIKKSLTAIERIEAVVKNIVMNGKIAEEL
jgi:signal transduction histidine kinase